MSAAAEILAEDGTRVETGSLPPGLYEVGEVTFDDGTRFDPKLEIQLESGDQQILWCRLEPRSCTTRDGADTAQSAGR